MALIFTNNYKNEDNLWMNSSIKYTQNITAMRGQAIKRTKCLGYGTKSTKFPQYYDDASVTLRRMHGTQVPVNQGTRVRCHDNIIHTDNKTQLQTSGVTMFHSHWPKSLANQSQISATQSRQSPPPQSPTRNDNEREKSFIYSAPDMPWYWRRRRWCCRSWRRDTWNRTRGCHSDHHRERRDRRCHAIPRTNGRSPRSSTDKCSAGRPCGARNGHRARPTPRGACLDGNRVARQSPSHVAPINNHSSAARHRQWASPGSRCNRWRSLAWIERVCR